ncbi:hypothetical protein OPKNFCMD_2164 [Methylobacterium crusticola]|uniref:Heme-binding protein n=1 Tax=Methylobacterium crusticola TaxID=1697972 RepID=A0ABQ4QX03_9HYPH|nr:heme-binding protein [Methylobacterium crusticola]GJD49434.1 hypothetical protein OPKNFCMD_2164 [Methylobacterium crusticola]
MRTKPVLTIEDARRIMAAARLEAERRRLEVSIAVVDEAGVLILLERLDGARLHTPDAATLKARTAAIVRTATADLQDQVGANPALLSFPGRMPLSGGVPLTAHGHVVGGVGSSGAQPDEDEAVCRAATAALAALPAEERTVGGAGA